MHSVPLGSQTQDWGRVGIIDPDTHDLGHYYNGLFRAGPVLLYNFYIDNVKTKIF